MHFSVIIKYCLNTNNNTTNNNNNKGKKQGDVKNRPYKDTEKI